MAEASFQPDTTDFAGQFMRGAEFGQNFMQRRQRQQWEAEDRAENQRVRQLFEPVLQAQRQAQIATALSSLETNKQQQQLRTRFAAEAPVYNEKYQAAMKLPTFAEQQAALAQLQPEVTWMGLIPEGKAFVDAVNNSRALAFQNQMTDTKIKAEEEGIRLRREAEIAAIRERGNEARKTAAAQGPTPDANQRLLNNLNRARQGGNQEEIAFYQAEYDKAVRGPRDPYQQVQDYRAQAAQYPAGSQQAKDLNALADKLTGQGRSAFTVEEFAGMIANYGKPRGATTTTPPGRTPTRVTPVVTPPPSPTGTTATPAIVKDPSFRW